MIYQLMYLSDAVRDFPTSELESLLEKARAYNEPRGITGCLIYGNGKFIQFIEGEKDQVVALYEKIEKDPRHNNVLLYQPAVSANRLFEEWSMGFKTLKEKHTIPEGYEDCRKWIYMEFVGTHQDRRKKDLFSFALDKELMESQVEPR